MSTNDPELTYASVEEGQALYSVATRSWGDEPPEVTAVTVAKVMPKTIEFRNSGRRVMRELPGNTGLVATSSGHAWFDTIDNASRAARSRLVEARDRAKDQLDAAKARLDAFDEWLETTRS